MSRASEILYLFGEQNDSGGTGGSGNGSGTSGSTSGNGGNTNGGNGGSSSGDSNGANGGDSRKPHRKKKRLGIRARFSPTVFNKCDCDKPKKDQSAYCRKFCGKDL